MDGGRLVNADPTQLTFTPANWNVAQAVTPPPWTMTWTEAIRLVATPSTYGER
ncbi:MAG: hypothetical protein H6644_09575 [Caldilineaceae bacterium]|nr:hypothetical protein [Caldilineaceae bacterium]